MSQQQQQNFLVDDSAARLFLVYSQEHPLGVAKSIP
jgi:hypothetical protein